MAAPSDTSQTSSLPPAGASRRQFLLNGRFLTRPPTGVDRVATELVRALNQGQGTPGNPPVRLDVAIPACDLDDRTIRDRLALREDCRILRSRLSGYAWEQGWLALLEPEATLLSLCNMGPVLRRRQCVLIHDAQVHDQPASYSPAFRLAYRLLQPALARRAATVASVSDYSRSRLQANGVGRARDIAVIPNGIDHLDAVEPDHGVLARLGLAPQGYLLAVGSLARHKNIAMLAEAINRRANTGEPLVIVGDINARVFGHATTSGQSGTDMARLVGRLSDAELKALYQNAALFLFPSLTEGFGLPPLEAMTNGCPVLASNGGAIPEVCGDAASYCDPRDPAAWAREIDALLSDPARREALATKGRSRAVQFTWARSARRLLDAIEGR